MTSNGEEIFFKIKRNTKLQKLQAAYANKVGKDVNTIRCVFSAYCYSTLHVPYIRNRAWKLLIDREVLVGD